MLADDQHRIGFTASEGAMDILRHVGRTEDVKFSPGDRRIAIAGFGKNRVIVLEVEVGRGRTVHIEGVLEISSPDLHRPHGVSFIDEQTLVVANRGKDAPIFALPPRSSGERKVTLSSVCTLRNDDMDRLNWPGSVAVSPLGGDLYELLICNNYVHYVTRHVIEKNAMITRHSSELLLQRRLSVPDGVSLDRARRWIAISNHDTHAVFLYENTPQLGPSSRPDGILRNLNYPHGVRFTPDGENILVADAGSPYVNVYARRGKTWHGVRHPVSTFRVLDEERYLRGRYHPTEGGPKGIDIDADARVLVTTCTEQGLAFFDAREILARRGHSMNWRVRSLRWRYEWIRDDLRRRRGWK
ncbi:MAG TPA: hypothetical protein VFB54_11635 [Burkholderiales bacterium]|nr:hypothetical protein [Burkholderiales bacterium]